MSASGQYQTITTDDTNGIIFVSSDYGDTWNQVLTVASSIFSPSMSYSGQYQIVYKFGGGSGSYFSSNYGQSWTSTTLKYSLTAMSSSGQYITAVDNNGYIYTCKNSVVNNAVIQVGGYTSGSGVTGVAGSLYYDTTLSALRVSNGSIWQTVINGVTGVGLTATNGATVTTGGYLQLVSAGLTSPGLVTTTGQTFAGDKYFRGSLGVSGVIGVGRFAVGPTFGTTGSLYYDTTVTAGATALLVSSGSGWTSVKSFVIEHPTNTEKLLVHGCLEGPEAGVYYRGESEITNNTEVTIELPDYVDKLATNLTIQVTPIYNGKVKTFNVSKVKDNKFTVYGENGEFFWTVIGQRLSFVVEPNKKDVIVKGDGPYKWI
jgi:hypothetical protein